MAEKEMHGLDKILNNLNKEIKNIPGRTLAGIIEAGLIVTRDMDKTFPRIPVDFGNLRSSQYMIASTGQVEEGGSPSFTGKDAAEMASGHSTEMGSATADIKRFLGIIIGFTASYAWFVHENVGADFARPKKVGKKMTKRRSGAGAKFLEAHLKSNKSKIIEAIRRRAKF